MGAPLRKQSTCIKDVLYAKPFEFEFVQAVKLLEQIHPPKEKLGTTALSQRESIRIRSSISLSVPPSDIYSITPQATPNAAVIMTINFLGIAGQGGPLPNVYNEIIVDRIYHHDFAARDFLDIFNHRIASIHYRIQVKYNMVLESALPHYSMAAKSLGYLGGLIYPEETYRYRIPQYCYLRYCGLLWEQPHSALGLEQFLTDFFNLPIHVEQFVGRWFMIEPNDVTRIGDSSQACYNRLGLDAALGTKVWLQQEKIRIHINFLDFNTYCALLPTGPLNADISEVVRHYLGYENKFDFALQLRKDQVPLTILDGSAALGYTSWIGVMPKDQTPEQVHVPGKDPFL